MTETKPKRGWFRFSLRTMFVLVTIIGVWLGFQVSTVYHRKRLLSRLDPAVGRYPTFRTVMRRDEFGYGPAVLEGEISMDGEHQPSWIRRALGDHFVPVILLPDSGTPEEVMAYRDAFPESMISQMPTEIGSSSTVRPAPGHHFEKLNDSFTIKRN
jgi:hypothetical protein